MQFLYILVTKRYNDITKDNIILCIYINKGFLSVSSNSIMENENLASYKVFVLIFKLRMP